MADDQPDPNAPLDFDRARFETAAPSELRCQSCERSIPDNYFTAGQAIVCEACRHQLGVQLARSPGAGTFLKAVAFGTAAAAAGAILWAVVVEVTGYELGLIAIVVGFLVGGAIRAATARRGGVLYQLMAVALTYIAIVSTYIPQLSAAFDAAVASEAAGEEGLAEETEPGAEPETADAGPEPAVVTGGAWIAKAIFIAALAVAAPFLAGFENIIGLLIIGFALWQAWSMNKRTEVVFAGPFRAGDAVADASS